MNKIKIKCTLIKCNRVRSPGYRRALPTKAHVRSLFWQYNDSIVDLV
jgi:hypothetical protein